MKRAPEWFVGVLPTDIQAVDIHAIAFPKFPTISGNDPYRDHYAYAARMRGITFAVDFSNQVAHWPEPPTREIT